MRWQVREAGGGAEAMALLDDEVPEVLLLDHWLPDLEVSEFAHRIQQMFPAMDLLDMNGEALTGGRGGPRRMECAGLRGGFYGHCGDRIPGHSRAHCTHLYRRPHGD